MNTLQINTEEKITALSLVQPNRSIKEETGTSKREIEEVNAAMKASPKKSTATNWPSKPNELKPVGKATNNVLTKLSPKASFATGKLINIGKVTIPARIPTEVSKLEIRTASLGSGLLLSK